MKLAELQFGEAWVRSLHKPVLKLQRKWLGGCLELGVGCLTRVTEGFWRCPIWAPVKTTHISRQCAADEEWA